MPSSIDVKADLHRLKVFFMDYKSTSVERIRARYEVILVKAQKQIKLKTGSYFIFIFMLSVAPTVEII